MSTGGFRIPLHGMRQPAAVQVDTGAGVHIETPHLVTRSLRASDVTTEFAQ